MVSTSPGPTRLLFALAALFPSLSACMVGEQTRPIEESPVGEQPRPPAEFGGADPIVDFGALNSSDPDYPTVACTANDQCDASQLCWDGFCRLKQRTFHPGSCTAHGCAPDHSLTANKVCADAGYRRALSQGSWQVAGDQIWVGYWTGENWAQQVIGGGRAMQSVTCTRLTPEEQEAATNPDYPTTACTADSQCDGSRLCWEGFCRLKQRSFSPGTCTAHACYPGHLPTADKICVDAGYRRAVTQNSSQVAGDQIWVGYWTGETWAQQVIGGGNAMQSVTCSRLTPEQQREASAICRMTVAEQRNCHWYLSYTVDYDWTGRDPSLCATSGIEPSCYTLQWVTSANYILK